MIARIALSAIAIALALARSEGLAAAGEAAYPNRPVRLITGSLGGASDFIARLVAQKLGERWGQQVVVDNRAGVAATVGTAIAAKSAPDGYTLAVGLTGTHAAPQFLYRTLPYDPVRDFAPVSLLSDAGIALVVHAAVPARDAKEFIAYARSRPGAVNYASAGAGATSQLAGELFNQMTKAQLVHVPYRGAGLALTGVLSAETPAAFLATSSVTPHLSTGRLRALAVLSEKRFQATPGIPSALEAGLPGVNASVWTGLFAPANTPRAIVNRINREVVDILRLPETREILARQGAEPIPSTPEAFVGFLEREISKWGKVISSAGLRAD
jgi:tripartite-type tricarboxylate transporter receptor subunit TctC